MWKWHSHVIIKNIKSASPKLLTPSTLGYHIWHYFCMEKMLKYLWFTWYSVFVGYRQRLRKFSSRSVQSWLVLFGWQLPFSESNGFERRKAFKCSPVTFPQLKLSSSMIHIIGTRLQACTSKALLNASQHIHLANAPHSTARGRAPAISTSPLSNTNMHYTRSFVGQITTSC